ncbi:MAG: excinuclease ABC subunit UvrC [Synergistaceae bacterium]|nr:excinuclease ABC subunit UvrC [Synergistaceae bacterium]
MKQKIAAVLKNLPEKPGVYIMRDAEGKVIYVGKAKKLKRRVSSYFRHGTFASPRLRKLVETVDDISTIRTATEAEALIVEARLIRRYSPFFNVDLKMTDRYPYICLTDEPFPRLVVTRRKPDESTGAWFGPYVSAGDIHNLLRLIERWLPLRTCRTDMLKPNPDKRPCIEFTLGRCMGACAGLCSEAEYRERVNDIILLLRGSTGELVERLRRRMDAAARRMEFEKAAECRDIIRALWRVSRQHISDALRENLDADTWAVLTKAQETFGLKTIPWRIDAFDISHMSGRETYGCCVVFEQGAPNPSLYRRFKIRSLADGEVDDFRSMKETVFRRYRRALDGGEPLPQLVLIDGGPVQLEFALSALDELKQGQPEGTSFDPPNTPRVVAIAKEEELLYMPGRGEPLALPLDDPVLRLMQRVRDEVHRYSVTTHRNARGGRLRRSVLEDAPGVGKARAARLLVQFGSARRIAMLEPEDLLAVPGIGIATARKIIDYLKENA